MTNSANMRENVEALRQNILRVSKVHKSRILIVEDSMADGQLLKQQLERQCVPSEISMATECEEAMQMLKGEPYDLVFLDLKFPKMNGVELLEAIGPETERIPFIALSGADEAGEMMQQALQHGAKAIFKKEPEYPMLAGICGAL